MIHQRQAMKLSQLIKAQNNTRTINELLQWQINKLNTLVSMDQPCWRLAGRLAVTLQRRGYKNAAARVQRAATDENKEELAKTLGDLLDDKGIFPENYSG